MPLRRLVYLSLVLSGPHGTVHAQFQVPLPAPMDQEQVCRIKAANERRLAEAESLSIRDDYEVCTIKVKTADLTEPTHEWIMRGRPSVFRSDSSIRALYSNKSLQVFSAFFSTVSENRAYLASSVLGGIMGRMHFDLSYAQVVTTGEDRPAGESPEEVRDATSAVMRLVQNGGSATARMLVPFLAGGGTTSKSAAGVYLNGGVIGPLGEADSLRGTAGLALDILTTHAIRKPEDYSLIGDVFVGFRAGFQTVWEDRGIISTVDDKTLTFLQAAIGVRMGDRTLASVLYTLVEDKFKPYAPEFQVSIQAARF
jgi:hypothetical protein